MICSDDSDLQQVQPYVFEHGVASFAEYHAPAAQDIVDRLWITWVPVQGSVSEDAFSEEHLMPIQWKSAAVYRVLGWYVLPRLAASIGGQGLLTMMEHYRAEFEREMLRIVGTGVEYDNGSGFERVRVLPISERQRLRR